MDEKIAAARREAEQLIERARRGDIIALARLACYDLNGSNQK